MATYFVTRHAGARAWAAKQGITVDRRIDHLDIAMIGPDDTVIGSLPVNLASEVCARGARYMHLVLLLPPELRGKELSATEMLALNARLEAFHVEKIGEGRFCAF
ncbi:MAG: CRISPR-associated protein Csx16 [Exilibacterium sp.]